MFIKIPFNRQYFDKKYQIRLAAQEEFEKEIQYNNVDNRVHNEQDETSNYEDYQDYNSGRYAESLIEAFQHF